MEELARWAPAIAAAVASIISAAALRQAKQMAFTREEFKDLTDAVATTMAGTESLVEEHAKERPNGSKLWHNDPATEDTIRAMQPVLQQIATASAGMVSVAREVKEMFALLAESHERDRGAQLEAQAAIRVISRDIERVRELSESEKLSRDESARIAAAARATGEL